jgi:hypothetical protein
MIRFLRPDLTTLPLSDGETIRVRNRLSAGEQRVYFARKYLINAEGKATVNVFQHGLALVTAFLVDWSARDDSGAKIEITGISVDDLTAILDRLDPDSYQEILDAIQAHVERQDAARAEKKTIPGGAPPLSPTSPSPSVAAGVLIGSAT